MFSVRAISRDAYEVIIREGETVLESCVLSTSELRAIEERLPAHARVLGREATAEEMADAVRTTLALRN